MRKLLSGLVAGLAVAGGAAAIAGAAQAQPYGYYAPGSADYGYRYEPPRAYDGYGGYTPYTYYNGYDGYQGQGGYAAPVGQSDAALGAAMASAVGHPVYDRYGPDPNGLLAPDGHQLKCKLMDTWDDYRHAYVLRRRCW